MTRKLIVFACYLSNFNFCIEIGHSFQTPRSEQKIIEKRKGKGEDRPGSVHSGRFYFYLLLLSIFAGTRVFTERPLAKFG